MGIDVMDDAAWRDVDNASPGNKYIFLRPDLPFRRGIDGKAKGASHHSAEIVMLIGWSSLSYQFSKLWEQRKRYRAADEFVWIFEPTDC